MEQVMEPRNNLPPREVLFQSLHLFQIGSKAKANILPLHGGTDWESASEGPLGLEGFLI